MVGSGAVSWLRIFECDGLDTETMAEVEGGGVEGAAADVNPEIELVARPPTTKAPKEIAADVYREATFLCGAGAAGAERAGATPLRAALDDRPVAEKFQHAADGDPLADGRIVEFAHDLRPPVPPFLVVLRRALRAACCSARFAR